MSERKLIPKLLMQEAAKLFYRNHEQLHQGYDSNEKERIRVEPRFLDSKQDLVC